jgi:ubiquinone/menaquinone biosynthesis C-methylase UbiE
MPEPAIGKSDQWQKIFGYILGYQATWIADIGLKAEFFKTIREVGEAGLHEEQLAERMGLNRRYVEVWCRAAYAFEYLDWDEASGYRLAPHMASLLLDTADPQFMGGRVQFYAALYEDFKAYPEYLRRGDVWPRSEHDPWILEALKNLTKSDPVMFTENVLPQAPQTLARLQQGGRILDVGAGAGFNIVHFARRFPASRVVGIEYDGPSAELARKTVADSDVADRVEVRHADANRLNDENAFDLVTLNIALHETGSWPEYQNVLRRVHRALEPGGTVLVSELPYPDDVAAYREQPIYKMLAGVQLHEALVGCGKITQGELRRLLEDAGFEDLRVAEQPNPSRFVMLAERPGA